MRVPIISKINAFVQQCENLSLAFDWDVSGQPTDVIWHNLHPALINHFTEHGLVFAIPDGETVDKTVMPWMVYMCSQSPRVDYMGPLLRVTNQISPEAVTHTHLQTWAKRYAALSGHNSARKLVFISTLSFSAHFCIC